MNFPTWFAGRESETKWTTKKEIYSFEEDADDKDHHSIFYVMFYDASKIKGEEEKDGIMWSLLPPS